MGLPKLTPYALPDEQDVPPARGPWQLDYRRAALLIHDMQQYFVDAFAPGEPPISTAIANMAALVARCRAAGVPVFYTCQPGDQDPRDRGLQKDLWGPGMTGAPRHQRVIDVLTPAAGDHVLTKHRYSAFQRTNLEPLLRVRGRDQLIVCGVFGHIGCLLTAGEAFQRDIEAFVVADAIADFSRAQHDLTLHYVADCCGVVLTTSQVEATLP